MELRARAPMVDVGCRSGPGPRRPPRGRDRHRACPEGGRADLEAGTDDRGSARQRIEVVLDWATARGARQGDNPARWKGHLEHLLKDSHKVVHHEAMLYTAIPAFMGELHTRDGVAARALEFLVLCASRTGEVLDARWSEIDLESCTW